MDKRLEIDDLTKPEQLETLKRSFSELADELDTLYSEVAPNGTIPARQGRVCLYDNSGTITWWLNTDGDTTWVQLAISSDALWEVDGTEHQLVTADEIDMQSKKIINLLDPIGDQDAATKKYHDDNQYTLPSQAGNAGKYLTTDGDDESWGAISGATLSLSNIIFAWSMPEVSVANEAGIYYGNASAPDLDVVSVGSSFYATDRGSYQTFLHFKWVKIAGVSTISIYSRLKTNGNVTATLNVSVGGQVNTVALTNGDWQWETSDIDVSSLTNGNAYDGFVQLKANSNGNDVYCSAVCLIAS